MGSCPASVALVLEQGTDAAVGADCGSRAPHPERRVLTALRASGAPILNSTTDHLSFRETVFQVGVVPVRIDLLTSTSGVGFEEAWAWRISASIESVRFGVPGREELLRNKQANGRPKDFLDVESLTGAARDR